MQVTFGELEDNVDVYSNIGHGGFVSAILDNNQDVTENDGLDIVHGSIISFDRIGGAGSLTANIDVSAGSTTVASGSISNNGSDQFFLVDAVTRSQIGHSPITTVGLQTAASDDQLDIVITENRITGNITVTDTDFTDDAGVSLTSEILAGGSAAVINDYATSRIGHASAQFVEGFAGQVDGPALVLGGGGDGTGVASNGSNVTVRQAHILGANISVDTLTAGTADNSDDALAVNNQDISLVSSVTAGDNAARDNTAVSHIGHGADTIVQTGAGGDQDGSIIADAASGDGGDITIVRGTVWDGGLVADNDVDDLDQLAIINTTDININSSNQVIIDSDTTAALASTDRSNSESQIGHGFRMRLDTGDGGTSSGTGAAGGAGGDVLVYQGVDAREYGVDNDRFDDYAYGVRGDVTIFAVDLVENAIDITSDDTSALASTNFNSDYSTLGHGDVIEITTGNGANGSAGRDAEGDNNALVNSGDADFDPTGQVAVYGGRGGHIDVQFGRFDARGNAIAGDSTSSPVLGLDFHVSNVKVYRLQKVISA